MKAGWELKTLGDAFQTVTGSTPPKARKDYYGNDVPLVKPPELIDGLVSDAVDGLTSKGGKVARIAPAGSILVSCIGNLGKIGLAACDLAFNQQINAIFPNNTKAISEFMFYQVLSPQFKSQIEALATGTTVPIVNKSRFNSITVNLPPLEEQKRIVSILDEAFEGLDRARENAEANLKSARELFEGYLATIFVKQKETWSKYKLGSLCKRITVGFVGPMAHKYQDEGIPFLRSQNVRPFEIDLKGIKYIDSTFNEELKKSKLLPGDVAIVRTGYPGTAATIPESLGQANCSDIVIATPGERLLPEFLVMFLNSDFGKRLVAAKSVGAAQKHFNVTAAKAVDFPTPTIQEQEHIVKIASRRKEECLNLEALYTAKLQDISDLRQSLLQKAFAGELT